MRRGGLMDGMGMGMVLLGGNWDRGEVLQGGEVIILLWVWSIWNLKKSCVRKI